MIKIKEPHLKASSAKRRAAIKAAVRKVVEDRSPDAIRAATAKKLRPHLSGGMKTPEQIRALVDAMWETAHNQELDRSLMLTDLAMLSGMASAALLDYAKKLEEER